MIRRSVYAAVAVSMLLMSVCALGAPFPGSVVSGGRIVKPYDPPIMIGGGLVLKPYQNSGETYEWLSGSSQQIDSGATVNTLGTNHFFNSSTLQVDNGATFTVNSVPIAPIANAFGSVSFNRAVKIATVTLTGGTDTGGGLGSWQNPESGTIVIQRAFVITSVVSTGANTIDVGTTTVGATTDSANLISAVNAHSALLATDNLTATTGQATLKTLASGKWVTVSTTPSTGGASAGLVGTLYIEYFNQ